MAPRAKKQKIHPDRTTTAAYAASQPLFSAIRNAITTLDTTNANLTVARDIVQSLHVKIANDDQHNDPSRHDAYMAAAINAWISSTEAFCKVFEELVNVSAPEPSEGREAGPRHIQFVKMLESVKRARELAEQSATDDKENRSTPPSQDEDHKVEEEATNEGFVAQEPAPYINGTGKRPMADPKPDTKEHNVPRNRTAVLGNVRYNKTGDKILWQNNELKVPYKTLEPDEKRAWGIVASRKKHEGRIKKQKQTKSSAQTASGDTNVNGADKGPQTKQPVLQAEIEFEDVSAEVEARLNAKAEKRAALKAKKSEKKRKRESGGSFTNDVQDNTPDPSEALEQSLAEKPARKKAKAAANNDVTPQVKGPAQRTSTTTSKKRRDVHIEPEPEVEGVNAEEADSMRKKRKKTKI